MVHSLDISSIFTHHFHAGTTWLLQFMASLPSSPPIENATSIHHRLSASLITLRDKFTLFDRTVGYVLHTIVIALDLLGSLIVAFGAHQWLFHKHEIDLLQSLATGYESHCQSEFLEGGIESVTCSQGNRNRRK